MTPSKENLEAAREIITKVEWKNLFDPLGLEDRIAQALRAKGDAVWGLIVAVESLLTDGAQDALEDPIGSWEREKEGFIRIGEKAYKNLSEALAKWRKG